MNKDDDLAIIALCSQIGIINGVKPLENKEWASVSESLIKNNKTPKELFDFSKEEFMSILNIFDENEIGRYKTLLERSSSLAFELENLNKYGVKIVTRASALFPKRIKKLLRQQSPPLFYYAGDLNLLNYKYIGFVGSRDVKESDIKKLKQLVKNADKINELLDQVSTKNNQITSNSSSISSLTTSGNQKTDSFQAQLKAIMNQTVTKKTNNTDNYKGAQTAQTIGTVTTTTGGLATATGASMLALSWGSNQLGTALMAGGGVATAAGTGTTSIAQATQGDTQNAVNTATNGLNSFTNNMMQVRQIKQDNNAA